jgi:hypothetical protein
MSSILKGAVGTVLALQLLLPSAGTAFAQTYRWVQYGPAGPEVRATTDKAECPSATVDGVTSPMSVRAAPGAQYPVTVCALALPRQAKAVSVDDVPVAAPVSDAKRILVIGDTGCRVMGSYLQACNDPVEWPFRLIAEVAAQLKPDLVLHVGDYHYRETACPAGNAGCAGSPFGDTWDVWQADLFAPAETLLRTAPWVLVRGNHEECRRGGQGWSRALDPYAFDAQKGCNGVGQPFAVSFEGLTIAVMDVAPAREPSADEAQAASYREQYKSLAGFTSGPTWLLQHRPIWSAGFVLGGKPVGDNKTLEVAAQDAIPANVQLVLSGHHHLFQALTYASDLPAQIVVGHGGDVLNMGIGIDPVGWTFGSVVVKSGVNMPGTFGFAMFEKQADGWQVTNRDRLGAVLKVCMLKGRVATC